MFLGDGLELIGDNSKFVMIEESPERASCLHVSDGTVNACDGTVNAWIAQSLHVRDGTVNSQMTPCLHIHAQLNYGLTQLMNELQTFESIKGGPSKGGENKTTTITAVDPSKAEANQASSSKAGNKRKCGQNNNPKPTKSVKAVKT